MKQFDVSLEPDEPARLLNNRIYPDDVSHWSLQEINPSRGYAAAMAVEGHDWRVTCFDMAEVNNVGLWRFERFDQGPRWGIFAPVTWR